MGLNYLELLSGLKNEFSNFKRPVGTQLMMSLIFIKNMISQQGIINPLELIISFFLPYTEVRKTNKLVLNSMQQKMLSMNSWNLEPKSTQEDAVITTETRNCNSILCYRQQLQIKGSSN